MQYLIIFRATNIWYLCRNGIERIRNVKAVTLKYTTGSKMDAIGSTLSDNTFSSDIVLMKLVVPNQLVGPVIG